METGFQINGTGTTEYPNEGKKSWNSTSSQTQNNCSGLIINLNVKSKIIKPFEESKMLSSWPQERACGHDTNGHGGTSGRWPGSVPRPGRQLYGYALYTSLSAVHKGFLLSFHCMLSLFRHILYTLRASYVPLQHIIRSDHLEDKHYFKWNKEIKCNKYLNKAKYNYFIYIVG